MKRDRHPPTVGSLASKRTPAAQLKVELRLVSEALESLASVVSQDWPSVVAHVASETGLTPETVRHRLRQLGHSPRSRSKTRRPEEVLARLVSRLETMASIVEEEELVTAAKRATAEQRAEWTASLASSLRVLRRFRRHLTTD
jgi:hypothetical protein